MSVRFHQFFHMYANLITRFKDSKVKVSEWTSLASQKVMIRVGMSSRDELDWAIWVI